MPDIVFRQHRNIELSTIEHINTQIQANWDNITVVKAFAEAYKQKLPVVAVEVGDVDAGRLEVGANTLEKEYSLTIDIFSTSNGQANDLAEFIVEDVIKNGWVYKEYSRDSGAETVSGVASGRVRVSSRISNRKLNFGDNPANFDKYRRIITASIRKA